MEAAADIRVPMALQATVVEAEAVTRMVAVALATIEQV